MEKAFSTIRESVGKGLPNDVEFAMKLMARQTTPSSGYSVGPIAAIKGRMSTNDELFRAEFAKTPGERYDTEEHNFRQRARSIQEAMWIIMNYDSRRAVSPC